MYMPSRRAVVDSCRGRKVWGIRYLGEMKCHIYAIFVALRRGSWNKYLVDKNISAWSMPHHGVHMSCSNHERSHFWEGRMGHLVAGEQDTGHYNWGAFHDGRPKFVMLFPHNEVVSTAEKSGENQLSRVEPRISARSKTTAFLGHYALPAHSRHPQTQCRYAGAPSASHRYVHHAVTGPRSGHAG